MRYWTIHPSVIEDTPELQGVPECHNFIAHVCKSTTDDGVALDGAGRIAKDYDQLLGPGGALRKHDLLAGFYELYVMRRSRKRLEMSDLDLRVPTVVLRGRNVRRPLCKYLAVASATNYRLLAHSRFMRSDELEVAKTDLDIKARDIHESTWRLECT
jgi:hypothetical protein